MWQPCFDETKDLRQKHHRPTLWVPQPAGCIVTENPLILWPPFEASVLAIPQRTIALSLCANESHPFPIKVTWANCSSSWLNKETNIIFKHQVFGTLTHITLTSIERFVNGSLIGYFFPIPFTHCDWIFLLPEVSVARSSSVEEKRCGGKFSLLTAV